MKKAETYLALLVGWSSMMACQETATEPETQTPFFPLEVGNVWTYAPENPLFGEPFEWVVTERVGDTAILSRPAGGSHPGPVRLVDDLSEIGLVLEGDGVVPFYRFSRGATWTHRDPWECDDGPTLRAVEEPNPVVTPAGTFENCIRIERLSSATCADAGTMVEWWAPNVGLVRWDELNFYAGGPLTFYLTEFALSF